MKIDAYTKVVLTIIALCLIWIGVYDSDLSSPVHAKSPVQEVVIVGVRVESQLLPVSVQEINVANPFILDIGQKGPILPIYGRLETKN